MTMKKLEISVWGGLFLVAFCLVEVGSVGHWAAGEEPEQEWLYNLGTTVWMLGALANLVAFGGATVTLIRTGRMAWWWPVSTLAAAWTMGREFHPLMSLLS